MEPWGPGKVKVGMGLSKDPPLSPQWQRCSQSPQAPYGWVSTSHPRWAGTKFPPSAWRTLHQYPARLSSEKASDASPCPRRGLGGQGTHLSWELHGDGGEGTGQGPCPHPLLGSQNLANSPASERCWSGSPHGATQHWELCVEMREQGK